MTSSPRYPSNPNLQFEYYDYTTIGGQSELSNTYSSSSVAAAMKAELLNTLLPNEMRRPLPASLLSAQSSTQQGIIAYCQSLLTSTRDSFYCYVSRLCT